MKKKILTTILLSLAILLTMSAMVQAYQIPNEYKPINQPFAEELNQYTEASDKTVVILQILAGGLLYFAAPVAIIFVIQGGFILATGGADSEKLDAAKKHFIWALLGLALIILSYSLVRAIIRFAFIAGGLSE